VKNHQLEKTVCLNGKTQQKATMEILKAWLLSIAKNCLWNFWNNIINTRKTLANSEGIWKISEGGFVDQNYILLDV